MGSYIPRKTKVKMEFYKGITISDIILAIICLGIMLLMLFMTGFPGHIKLILSMSWIAISVCLFLPIADGKKLYTTLWILIRFIGDPKKFSKQEKRKHKPMSELIPYVDIRNDLIDIKEYHAGVLEIRPVEFGLLNEEKQEAVINTFAMALKAITVGQQASIIKITKPIVMDGYIYNEDRKYDSILEMVNNGEMTQEEADARYLLFEDRMQHLRAMSTIDKTYKEHFYIVIYDTDREAIVTSMDEMISAFSRGVVPMVAKRLRGEEISVFLKAQFGTNFNESDVSTISMNDQAQWSMPNDVVFKVGKTLIDGVAYKNFAITDYPLNVPNAWAYPLFNLEASKVVINLTPLKKDKAEKTIDRSIVELEGRMNSVFKSSKQIDLQTQHETLQTLMQSIKVGNEDLFDVHIHIMTPEHNQKEVRSVLKQNGFAYSDMFGRQVSAFVSQNISMRDTTLDALRQIHTTALATSFPFISSSLEDEAGFYMGYNNYPVFIDFFERNNERVNSNMIVIGKSGSGKSYATSTLLANLSADNARIFILDPENEYTALAHGLKGKFIDVGSSMNGIMNPFHVYTTLSEDEGGGSDSFSQHLQFLEEFFRVIFDGMSGDAFEILNSLVVEVYKRKNIDTTTNLSTLKPEDYPIFDDVYKLICEKVETQTDEYLSRNLQILQTYVQKFSTGGRNSNLWNGPTSIETKENFICFNFQSLMANRNIMIANAQMLMVFKYLDNEISKNKDFNTKYGTHRKIVVAVDEAHLFINPKFPIALDFMAQMAKRIRKYEGMQIVITQNIKDFIGSAETLRQASAVINASQYSMIFSLAPNDMTDLVNLYRNAGGINQDEQDTIVTAGRGQCFFIASPYSRTTFMVEASEAVKELAKLNKR